MHNFVMNEIQGYLLLFSLKFYIIILSEPILNPIQHIHNAVCWKYALHPFMYDPGRMINFQIHVDVLSHHK